MVVSIDPVVFIYSKTKGRLREKDLIKIPANEKDTTTTKSSKRVPSWHLTSKKAMEFIEDTHNRTVEKKREEEKEKKIKKETLQVSHNVERK